MSKKKSKGISIKGVEKVKKQSLDSDNESGVTIKPVKNEAEGGMSFQPAKTNKKKQKQNKKDALDATIKSKKKKKSDLTTEQKSDNKQAAPPKYTKYDFKATRDANEAMLKLLDLLFLKILKPGLISKNGVMQIDLARLRAKLKGDEYIDKKTKKKMLRVDKKYISVIAGVGVAKDLGVSVTKTKVYKKTIGEITPNALMKKYSGWQEGKKNNKEIKKLSNNVEGYLSDIKKEAKNLDIYREKAIKLDGAINKLNDGIVKDKVKLGKLENKFKVSKDNDKKQDLKEKIDRQKEEIKNNQAELNKLNNKRDKLINDIGDSSNNMDSAFTKLGEDYKGLKELCGKPDQEKKLGNIEQNILSDLGGQLKENGKNKVLKDDSVKPVGEQITNSYKNYQEQYKKEQKKIEQQKQEFGKKKHTTPTPENMSQDDIDKNKKKEEKKETVNPKRNP